MQRRRLPSATQSTQSETTTPQNSRRDPRSVAGRRVLVVDDNHDAADLRGELVQRRGHDVTVVHDPESARAVLTKFRPEVAILDIGLPDIAAISSRHGSTPSCRSVE